MTKKVTKQKPNVQMCVVEFVHVMHWFMLLFTVSHNFARPAHEETRGPHIRGLRVSKWMYGRWALVCFYSPNTPNILWILVQILCQVSLNLLYWCLSSWRVNNHKWSCNCTKKKVFVPVTLQYLLGVCKMYEEHLKRMNPNSPSITYDISQLFDFIDDLADLSCLVWVSLSLQHSSSRQHSILSVQHFL